MTIEILRNIRLIIAACIPLAFLLTVLGICIYVYVSDKKILKKKPKGNIGIQPSKPWPRS